MRDGTFIPIKEEDIKGEPRIFGSRFVDELKKVGDRLKKKSRLVAQNYADDDATAIATKAPTVQRFAQRVALSIAASYPELIPYTRDITQAYIQSHTDLERDVYIRAPKELGLQPGFVLKVVRPLYGIPESGLHWYLTYLSHHLETLGMHRATADPCVLIKRSNNEIEGLILLQVDDSLGFCTPNFMEDEERASTVFRCKPRTPISTKPISFNGIYICKKGETYSMTHGEKIDKLECVETQKAFVSQKALAQYIGVNVRPDVCASIQLVAPGSKPTSDEEYKTFKRTVKSMIATRDQGLNFIKLDIPSTKLILLTDASFANAEGMKSKLGYMIAMVDKFKRCNIIHFGSNKCKRIARSVMAAEIQALVLGFDYAYVIQHLVEEIIGRTIKLEAMIDSKTVFNVVAKDGQTAEKRLQIDVLALRQSYDLGELDRIAWIPGHENPADSLTKPVLTKKTPMFAMMESNNFGTEPHGWAVSHERRK